MTIRTLIRTACAVGIAAAALPAAHANSTCAGQQGSGATPNRTVFGVTADQRLRHPFALPEPRVTLVDASLNYTPGVPAAGIAAIAYANNDLDANTGTTLVDLDAALNQAVLQAPANTGSLTLTGKLGVDPDALIGFDIHTRKTGGAASSNVGFASMNVAGVAQFYRVELLTGRASLIGTLAQPLVDIAVTLDP